MPRRYLAPTTRLGEFHAPVFMAQLEDWKKVVGDPLINDQPEASYDDFLSLTWD